MKTCMACGAPMETDESICTACGLEQTAQRFLSREHYQTWNRETAEQREKPERNTLWEEVRALREQVEAMQKREASAIRVLTKDDVKRRLRQNQTEFSIPDGITDIGERAFEGYVNLTEITIPDSVRYIGEYAFLNCESLKEIELPEQLVRIGAGAFCGCEKLEHIEIPEFVDEIESDTFRRCESLTEIRIPWGVSFIDRYAFAECRNLSKIVLPETIGEIEYNAFSGVRARVCYPSDSRDEEWIGKDYSGTLIWQAVEPEE